jgi:hypothetical protein
LVIHNILNQHWEGTLAFQSCSMINCGTKHRVIVPTSKLNSSDF